MGAFVTEFFSVRKDVWCPGVHLNLAFWWVNNVNGLAILIKSLMLFMAWVFDGSGLMPVVVRMCVRYWIS